MAQIGYNGSGFALSSRVLQASTNVVPNTQIVYGAAGTRPKTSPISTGSRLALNSATTRISYVLGYVGNTHNDFRDTDRKLYGGDVRLTNRDVRESQHDRLRQDQRSRERNGTVHAQQRVRRFVAWKASCPVHLRLQRRMTPTATACPDYLDSHPVDRTFYTAGMKSRWIPFYDYCDVRRGLSVTGGYEWAEINRRYVDYEIELGEFTQPNTITNMLHVGLSQDWSRKLQYLCALHLAAQQLSDGGRHAVGDRREFNTVGAASFEQLAVPGRSGRNRCYLVAHGELLR